MGCNRLVQQICDSFSLTSHPLGTSRLMWSILLLLSLQPLPSGPALLPTLTFSGLWYLRSKIFLHTPLLLAHSLILFLRLRTCLTGRLPLPCLFLASRPFWPRCPPHLETALTMVANEPPVAKTQWVVFRLHRTQMLSCISEQIALPPSGNHSCFSPSFLAAVSPSALPASLPSLTSFHVVFLSLPTR